MSLYSPLYLADAFSDADRERFKDPVAYKQFRHELEMEMTVRTQPNYHFERLASDDQQRFHALMNPRSEMQRQAREFFEADMKRRLARKPWIADHCK